MDHIAGMSWRFSHALHHDAFASANEVALYGVQLLDVRFLRQRGYGVHMEGSLFRVGNRLISRRRLVEVARRERSLIGGS